MSPLKVKNLLLFVILINFSFSVIAQIAIPKIELSDEKMSSAFFSERIKKTADKVILHFSAYKPSPGATTLSGYMGGISIYINSTQISEKDLINRPLEFELNKSGMVKTFTKYRNRVIILMPICNELSNINDQSKYFPKEGFNPSLFSFDITKYFLGHEKLEIKFINHSPKSNRNVIVEGITIEGAEEIKSKSISISTNTNTQTNKILFGKSDQIEFSIDELNKAEETLLFSLRVRLNDDKFQKMRYGMKVFVNGEILRPSQPYTTRLLNRDLLMKSFSAVRDSTQHIGHGSPISTMISLFQEKIGGGTKKEAEKSAECKEGIWLVRQSNDYMVRNRDYQTHGEDFNYEWDITDMVSQGKNQITIENVYPDKNTYLETQAEISILKKKSPLPKLKDAENQLLPLIATGKEMNAEFLENGEIKWSSDKTMLLSNLEIETFGNGVKSSETIRLKRNKSNELLYETKNIGLIRSIDKKDRNSFIIKDSITSRATTSLIFRVNNIQQYLFPTSEVKVAGITYPACMLMQATIESQNSKRKILRRRFANNPTLFIKSAFTSGGIGFMLLDDDSRNHHAFDLCTPETKEAGWNVGWYELKPGEKMQLQWEVSFIENGDYFTFINKIRDELGVNNVTIESFSFVGINAIEKDMTDTEISDALKAHNTKYLITWGGYIWPDPATAPPPYDIIFGTSIMYPENAQYMDKIKKATARIKKIAPSVKVLPYIHLTVFGTSNAEDMKKYENEMCRNQDGTIAARTWGAKSNSRYKKNTCSITMMPQKNMPYGKEITRVLNYYIDELGVGGFFFDEFEGSFYDYRDIKDENVSSKYIDITPNGKIYRARTVGVHSNDFVEDILRALKKKNLSAFGNGGNLDLRLRNINNCPTFSEARLNLYQPPYSVHLDTPVALWYRPNVQTVKMLLNEGLIPGGTALRWENNLTAHLYPFTPQKIGQGFVIGREALISAEKIVVPNSFANVKLENYSYSPDGTMKKTHVHFNKGEKLQIPENGFTILRKD